MICLIIVFNANLNIIHIKKNYKLKNKEILIKELKTLEIKIENFKEIINTMIEKLKNVKNNMKIYLKIAIEIIHSYNPQERNNYVINIINEFPNFNNNIINDINDIIKYKNNQYKFKKITEIYYKMNNKKNFYDEQIINEDEKEFYKKINHNFTKNPNELKKNNDINFDLNENNKFINSFETFVSYKDNKEYIIISIGYDSKYYMNKFKDLMNGGQSSPIYQYEIILYSLIDFKKIKTLLNDSNVPRNSKYFFDKISYKEYLIIIFDNNLYIFDITNNYEIIIFKMEQYIQDCLLVFPYNDFENNFITNSNNQIKLYSLTTGNFIKDIVNNINNSIYWILSWFNNRNNSYYIIYCFYNQNSQNDQYYKISIINILTNETFFEFNNNNNYNVIISNKNKNNIDYLYLPKQNYIEILDLFDKKFINNIYLNNINIYNNLFMWNEKYFFNCNYIIDIESSHINKLQV